MRCEEARDPMRLRAIGGRPKRCGYQHSGNGGSRNGSRRIRCLYRVKSSSNLRPKPWPETVSDPRDRFDVLVCVFP